MHDRTEWTRGQSGPLKIKGKEYKNLVEFTRPCATCEEPFSIYVTSKIANGHADSNSFGLKNCEKHRRNKSSSAEEEKLRTANVTMSEELTGLYASNKALFEELQVCKAKLAKYELPAALVDHAASLLTTAAATPFGTDLGQAQKVTTTNGALPSKLPWE